MEEKNSFEQKKMKEFIDRTFRIDSELREIKEEPKHITMFPQAKHENLVGWYFREELKQEGVRKKLQNKYFRCKDKIETMEIQCKDSLLEYLVEKWHNKSHILFTLEDYYDDISRKECLKAIKIRNGEEADFLSEIGIQQIKEKYEKMRNEANTSKKMKYLKLTGFKLGYLEEEITTSIHCLKYVKDNIIYCLTEIPDLYTSNAISLYPIKKLLDTYEELADLINKKYDEIISKKDFSKKAIYFSERECLDIDEICVLIAKAHIVRYLIVPNIERIIRVKC